MSFYCLKFVLLLVIVNLCLFPNLRSFSHFFHNFFFLKHESLFLFWWYSNGTNVTHFDIVPQVCWYFIISKLYTLFIFYWGFSSLILGQVFSIDLSLSFTSLSMVLFILALSHMVIFNFRYFICIAFISWEFLFFHSLKVYLIPWWLKWLQKKNLPAMQETQDWYLSWEDPLAKGMTTHCSILAWRIPGTEEPGRLQSMGS